MTQPINLRLEFAKLIYAQMKLNQDIWIVTGDLGFGMWDQIQMDFPDRFLNTGAAEQAMMGIAVGLAQAGKIPLVYSITPFLLYRPFETIRNYIHHEQIPVKLIGSGRNMDYECEGFSHWAEEDVQIMSVFSNIQAYWPTDLKQLKEVTEKLINTQKPYYLNLSRAAT